MTQSTSNTSLITRWHQEPWAWLVFGLPAAAVIACMATIVIAVKTDDGVVVDDYYKRGLEINKVLVREDRARELGLSLDDIALADDFLSFRIAGAKAFEFPDQMSVQLLHATVGRGDLALDAIHVGEGLYQARLTALPAGPWYLDISHAGWRLIGRFES